MAAGSKKVIIAALIGNSLIAVTKFAAAAYTGSSAMVSEGIHSLVDTGNQGLLLYGLRRSNLPADAKHPFGYGRELYFWAFVVAIMIFAVGAGFSIYEGIDKIRHPHPVESVYINYIVLGLAMIFESWAFRIAWKEFQSQRNGRSMWATIKDSKDPTVITVLFEDSAAMLGLMVAFVGLLIGQMLGLVWMDGAASVVIGLILAITACVLAIETKGLLIGESAKPEITALIRRMALDEPAISRVNEARSIHFGPHDVLVTVSLDFQDQTSAAQIEKIVSRIETRLKSDYPEIRSIYLEVQSHKDHITSMQAAAQKAALD